MAMGNCGAGVAPIKPAARRWPSPGGIVHAGVTFTLSQRRAMTSHHPAELCRRSFLVELGVMVAGVMLRPDGAESAEEEKKLHFYNWDTYIGQTTLSNFKKASGIQVKMDLYADNDELFAKLREGNPGYDVI